MQAVDMFLVNVETIVLMTNQQRDLTDDIDDFRVLSKTQRMYAN